ncbi:MAG: RNA polymerase sigma-54 factor, partial [Cyclobacteriaceae bacterium]|nr:RNA polymerase sigma-54 factor [Cyclobacteriaceae bacterium]
MQKLGLTQSLQQKLSPQQIQFIKLLQVPTAELENRIEEELELNPVLEEGEPEGEDEDFEESEDEDIEETSSKEEDIDIKDYLQDDDYSGYKTHNDVDDEEDKEMPMPTSSSLQETLLTQLGFLGLDERQLSIGKQLIGSIEGDGYIRRDMEAIVNDLAFSLGIETSLDEVEEILARIQAFDPAGIAARNLKECLLLQLERMDDGQDVDVIVAKRVLNECYEEFTKKH